MISDFNSSPAQQFTFELEENKYRIKSIADGKYLSISNDSLFAGSAVRVDSKGHQS